LFYIGTANRVKCDFFSYFFSFKKIKKNDYKKKDCFLLAWKVSRATAFPIFTYKKKVLYAPQNECPHPTRGLFGVIFDIAPQIGKQKTK